MARKIRLEIIERGDGGITVVSDHIPELVLSGSDPLKVMADIWPALEHLTAHDMARENPFQ